MLDSIDIAAAAPPPPLPVVDIWSDAAVPNGNHAFAKLPSNPFLVLLLVSMILVPPNVAFWCAPPPLCRVTVTAECKGNSGHPGDSPFVSTSIFAACTALFLRFSPQPPSPFPSQHDIVPCSPVVLWDTLDALNDGAVAGMDADDTDAIEVWLVLLPPLRLFCPFKDDGDDDAGDCSQSVSLVAVRERFIVSFHRPLSLSLNKRTNDGCLPQVFGLEMRLCLHG
mmetsp:Transcript_24761/g.69523  ORF Transcript_24761/g.69523 Transcript_24761/m.69523 type:complete len:224 (+) Transcript_24761:1388-2059(+)